MNINKLKKLTKGTALHDLFNDLPENEGEFFFLTKLGDYMTKKEQETRYDERDQILQTLIDFEWGDGSDVVAEDMKKHITEKHNIDGLADIIQSAYTQYFYECRDEANKEGYEKGFKNATDMLKGFIKHHEAVREMNGAYGKTFEYALEEYIKIMTYR